MFRMYPTPTTSTLKDAMYTFEMAQVPLKGLVMENNPAEATSSLDTMKTPREMKLPRFAATLPHPTLWTADRTAAPGANDCKLESTILLSETATASHGTQVWWQELTTPLQDLELQSLEGTPMSSGSSTLREPSRSSGVK